MAERAVRAQAPGPGREPADPLPQPRGAAPRRPARGDDRARARERRPDHRRRSATGRGWGLTRPLRRMAAAQRRRAARWPPRASSSRDEPVLVGPADALHREQIHPHIAAFADERLDAMALRLAGRAAQRRRRAACRRLPVQPRARSRCCSTRRDGDATRWPACASTAATSASRTSTAACRATAARTGCSRATGACSRSCAATSIAAAFPTCEFQGPVEVHPTAAARAHAHPRAGDHRPAAPGSRTPTSGRTRRSARTCTIDGVADRALDRARRRRAAARRRAARDERHRSRRAGRPQLRRARRAMRLSVGDGAEVTLT